MNELIFSSIPKNELLELIETAVSNAFSNQKEPELSDELLSRAELKEYTGIGSDVTVIRMERLGVFKPIRLGRRLFYKKSEIRKSLDNLQRK